MQSSDYRWAREIEGKGRRSGMINEEAKIADLNNLLGKLMFWAAGLSIIFLLAHYLRWIVNG